MALLTSEFTTVFWTRFAAMSDWTTRVKAGHRFTCKTDGQNWPEEPEDTDLPDTRLILTQFGVNLWGGSGTGARSGRPAALFEWHVRLRTLDMEEAETFCQMMMNLFAGGGGPTMGTSGATTLHVQPGDVAVTIDDETERFFLLLPITVQFLNVSARAERALA